MVVMRPYRVISVIAALLVLAGCRATAETAAPDAGQLGEAGRSVGDMPVQQVPSRSVSHGTFGAYREGLIGRGEKIALYFCASWQPFCIRNEHMVEGWYASDEPFPINAYRVEYDSPLTDKLKTRFGVTDPDTWVIVDGSGKYYRRLQGANPVQLRTFLLADSSAS